MDDLHRWVSMIREAEAARRQAEQVSAVASLAHELSGTLDPTTMAQRTVDSSGAGRCPHRDPPSGWIPRLECSSW